MISEEEERMTRSDHYCAFLAAFSVIASSATASVTITQGASGPTYSDFSLNFDEAGTVVGPVSESHWDASHQITLNAGDHAPSIQNLEATPGFEWAGDENVFYGGYGVFLNFANDIESFSAQIWDNAGPPSPFGTGGMIVEIRHQGKVVGFDLVAPTFGPGDAGTWFDIVGDNGAVFDEIRFVGQGFGGLVTYMDNATWNVPAPSAIAVLAIGGLASSRRRRV
jgi:hypothetical protein